MTDVRISITFQLSLSALKYYPYENSGLSSVNWHVGARPWSRSPSTRHGQQSHTIPRLGRHSCFQLSEVTHWHNRSVTAQEAVNWDLNLLFSPYILSSLLLTIFITICTGTMFWLEHWPHYHVFFLMSAAKLDAQRCCSLVCTWTREKAAARPEPKCCRDLFGPAPQGNYPGLKLIQQNRNQCSRSILALPHTLTYPSVWEAPAQAAQPRPRHSLAFSTEDPAACHKS